MLNIINHSRTLVLSIFLGHVPQRLIYYQPVYLLYLYGGKMLEICRPWSWICAPTHGDGWIESVGFPLHQVLKVFFTDMLSRPSTSNWVHENTVQPNEH
jgi:hypothetical protein